MANDWFTDEYEAQELAEFRRIRAKHPDLVNVPFECNMGWYHLVEDYFDEVARLLAEHPGSFFEMRQVKEKFGCLRLYCRPSEDIREAVKAAYDRAAAEADRTCEVCGKPGVLRIDRGHFATRCDEHSNGVPPTSWNFGGNDDG